MGWFAEFVLPLPARTYNHVPDALNNLFTFVAAELAQGLRLPSLLCFPGRTPARGRRKNDQPSPGVSCAGSGTPKLPGAPDPKLSTGSGATSN